MSTKENGPQFLDHLTVHEGQFFSFCGNINASRWAICRHLTRTPAGIFSSEFQTECLNTCPQKGFKHMASKVGSRQQAKSKFILPLGEHVWGPCCLLLRPLRFPDPVSWLLTLIRWSARRRLCSFYLFIFFLFGGRYCIIHLIHHCQAK